MYERIMVPLDGSNASEMVLSYAEEIATRFNSELALVSVAEPAPAESDHLFRAYLKTIQEKVRAELGDWGAKPAGPLREKRLMVSEAVACANPQRE